ncbi:MAG: 16S rRNA (adenine(1518)-N(6)/adenine(1519)-N(6))-dimethyltransferase RsmA [Acidobacteriota bacterium]|nr:16S rRNA (adenine(1518)-N(6)/adenine(1519)-N(6))-dimethyltransferase RsmA [Acidobacteriota bacterium]
MIPARKRWGQHFLVHPDTAERIVGAARLTPVDTVVEVGPGDGALTRLLRAKAGRLLAIEIDPLRSGELEREMGSDPDVRILRGDALDQTFSDWLHQAGWSGPAIFVSNLPYNAATPILLAAIAEPAAIGRCVATVQKEVGARLAARPGGEHYGYLTVRVAAYSQARVLFDLPPGAFRPRPKVVSSVIELTPRAPALDPALRDRAVAIASLAFRSRRKTLPNALAGAGGRAPWEAALEAIGKDPRSRGEVLALEDYLALASSAAAVALEPAPAPAPVG